MESPEQPAFRVAVVGAGISGLSFAYRLQREAQKAGRPVAVTLLEAGARPGGVIETRRTHGCLLEQGPDCWASNKPAGVELARELGLEAELIGTRPGVRRSFILHQGELRRLPEGFFLISPMSVRAVAATPLLTPWGKLRMALELFMPARREDSDESLADFVRRRFGREALARIAQPMVAGIYTADPEKLSLKATFPQFLQWEREQGSVIRALRARAAAEKASGSATGGEVSRAAGPRYGLFVTLRGGLDGLPRALERALTPGTLRLTSIVAGMRREGQGWELKVGSTAEHYDALCLALPAHRSAALLREPEPALSAMLAEFEYAGSAVVNFVFRRSQVAHPMDGIGAVIPAAEHRKLVAFSFSSVKFEGRAPDGMVVLRAFMGGALNPELAGKSPAELASIALAELRDLVGLRGEPLHVEAASHHGTMAQYHVGHLDRVARVRAALAAAPRLCVIGNAFDGVSIPDCIRNANDAARALLRQLAP
ncbi:MAG: protoporphyrinogen oxidase [Planctomycetes bacterium]|nr:protoporphyrinogen oxidase [Planctomycetota bacterium]